MGIFNTKLIHPNKTTTYRIQCLSEHTSGINALAVNDDGSVLATGSDDHTVRLWATNTELCECVNTLIGHEDYVTCVAIDEAYVISGSADKTVRKWDIASGDCLLVLRGHKSLVNRVFSTGDLIFTSSYDRTVRCWDIETGECVRVFVGHKRGVYPMVFIPIDDEEEGTSRSSLVDADGVKAHDLLVTGSADHTAIVWSFETGKIIHSLKEHTGAVTCLSVDSDGLILLTGSTDHTIRSWNLRTGQRVRVFEGHQSSVICLTVVNKMLYSGSSDHTSRAWIIEYGDCTRTFVGHEHTVSCVKVHNGLVFTGSGDGNARCFDAKSGTLKRTFKGHQTTINSLQIAGEKLYTVSHDSTLCVWDISGIADDAALIFGNAKPSMMTTTTSNFNNNDTRSNHNSFNRQSPFTPKAENGNAKIFIEDD